MFYSGDNSLSTAYTDCLPLTTYIPPSIRGASWGPGGSGRGKYVYPDYDERYSNHCIARHHD